MKDNYFLIKSKCIIILALSFFLISIGLQTKDLFINDSNYKIEYEYVNIKDMAQASVANKEKKTNVIRDLFIGNTYNGKITEVSLPTTKSVEAVELPTTANSLASSTVPRRIWYLPTEVGQVTQYPHYGHAAYDITSSRTYSENIFPVANGVISGIYTDPAGAKVVTILHNIDGVKYTSQYAHLSRYNK